ncbi:MAG: hypothetical protein ACYDD1_19110 [Caulobacteraceae bacterium]
MMKSAAALGAIVLAGLVNGQAHAQTPPSPSPVFAAYQDLCLTSAGDPAKAMAAAHDAGWSIPPAADLLPLGALSMNDGQQFERKAGAVNLHLAIGHASDPAQLGADAAPWRVCVVSAEPADPQAGAALARWTGVAPTKDSDAAGGSLLFLLSGKPGAWTSADGLDEAKTHALVQAHGLVAVGARTAGPLTILLYAAPGQ